MQRRELDIDQLLGIERSMPVPADGHWFGQQDAGSVDGLEDSLHVDPPRYLFNQDRGHPL